MTDDTTENENSEVTNNIDEELTTTAADSPATEESGENGQDSPDTEATGAKGTELYAIAGIVLFLIVIIFTWPSADEGRLSPTTGKSDTPNIAKNSREQHELRKKNAEKFRNNRAETPKRPRPSTLDQLKSGLPDGAKVGTVVPYEELQTIRKNGDDWQSPGAAIIQAGYNLMVAWDKGVTKAEKINISFDNNDQYLLTYENGTEKVGSQTISRPPGGVLDGLQQMLISVPHLAVEKGYDKVIITPSGGDKLYSIGHFVLVDPTFTPVKAPNRTAKATSDEYKKPRQPIAPVSKKSPDMINKSTKEKK